MIWSSTSGNPQVVTHKWSPTSGPPQVFINKFFFYQQVAEILDVAKFSRTRFPMIWDHPISTCFLSDRTCPMSSSDHAPSVQKNTKWTIILQKGPDKFLKIENGDKIYVLPINFRESFKTCCSSLFTKSKINLIIDFMT